MVTNTTKVVCPKCGSINSYEIIKIELIDNELHTSYSCEACRTDYTDIFALTYLGGNTNSCEYDRDNLKVSR